MINNSLRGQFRKLREHEGFRRYFSNTSWVFVGKVFTLVLSFFLFSYITRYLGPANLGKLSYAQSFVGLLAVFASFGIDHVLYRDLVKYKERRNELLGSALFIKILLGIITFFVTLGIAYFSEGEKLIVQLIGIIALTNIFQPLTLPSFYFDAVQRSRINTIGMIVVSIIMAILKIMVIVFDKGIIYFAAVTTFEAVLNGTYFIFLYSYYYDTLTKWSVKIAVIKSLLRQSLPLLLASISAVIYSRIDQIMLMHYLDSAAVGLYSVAARISEVWNFIPGLIIYSFFPAIVNAKLVDEKMYLRRFARLLLGVTSIAAFFALGVTLFAKLIITIISGSEYLSATGALQIYVWGVVGAVVVNTFQQLLVTEGWVRITFYITVIGAVINVLLNIWFIPKYGINGAAYATLIAYWMVPFSLLFFPQTRGKMKALFMSSR